jgi:hypothetical protein
MRLEQFSRDLTPLSGQPKIGCSCLRVRHARVIRLIGPIAQVVRAADS